MLCAETVSPLLQLRSLLQDRDSGYSTRSVGAMQFCERSGYSRLCLWTSRRQSVHIMSVTIGVSGAETWAYVGGTFANEGFGPLTGGCVAAILSGDIGGDRSVADGRKEK